MKGIAPSPAIFHRPIFERNNKLDKSNFYMLLKLKCYSQWFFFPTILLIMKGIMDELSCTLRSTLSQVSRKMTKKREMNMLIIRIIVIAEFSERLQ